MSDLDAEKNTTILGLQLPQISVKATTNEGLGALRAGEGCAAYAVALIQSRLPQWQLASITHTTR
jgi:2C-methyl-D-erythritol 2,4-cyclodiphosphate synthase